MTARGLRFRHGYFLFSALALIASKPSSAAIVPIRLASGTNTIANIAGTGEAGAITLQWRDNGNAWGYDKFTVTVGNSIATIAGKDSVIDTPHLGEDTIRSVRFARLVYRGRVTLHLMIASRSISDSTYSPAKTKIEQYALIRNSSGIGTPFEFVKTNERAASRLYCNAEMALWTELGLPLTRSYAGQRTPSGC